jgi:hypothetical protein
MVDSTPTKHPQISTERMQRDSLVRFNNLNARGIPLMFIDSRVAYDVRRDRPYCQRKPSVCAGDHNSAHLLVGMGVAGSGNGSVFHTPDYVEIFVILHGTWRFSSGNVSDSIRR